MKVETIESGPGFSHVKVDMSDTTNADYEAARVEANKQHVVRLGDPCLRERRLHHMGERIAYTEADDWTPNMIVLAVPMTDLFDIEVYERTRMRIIPKTSLAASLLWDWLDSDPKTALVKGNVQHTGHDDVRYLEVTFGPRKKPEPVAPAPAPKPAKKRRKPVRRRVDRGSNG